MLALRRVHWPKFGLGNPANDRSIADLAQRMVSLARADPWLAETAARVRIACANPEAFYGAGYQDATRRVPSIAAAERDLGWHPCVTLDESLRRLLAVCARG